MKSSTLGLIEKLKKEPDPLEVLEIAKQIGEIADQEEGAERKVVDLIVSEFRDLRDRWINRALTEESINKLWAELGETAQKIKGFTEKF